MELNELHIGKWQTCSGDHGSSVSSAGVGRSTGLVGSSVSSSSDDGIECSDSVNGAIGDTDAGDSSANSFIVHDQVESKIFDEDSGLRDTGALC